jgi:hypothetical protein
MDLEVSSMRRGIRRRLVDEADIVTDAMFQVPDVNASGNTAGRASAAPWMGVLALSHGRLSQTDHVTADSG